MRRRRRRPGCEWASRLDSRAAHRLGGGIERPARACGHVERIGQPRRRTARRLPRRSSRRCRCTATAAAPRSEGHVHPPAPQARRAPRYWRRPRRRRPARSHPAVRRQRAPRPVDRGSRPPPAGTRRRYPRRDIGRCRAPRSTALLSPAKEKCGSLDPTSGRGSGTAVASPSIAARSTAGPPGKPRPSSLAVLSNASPAASSIVVASRR